MSFNSGCLLDPRVTDETCAAMEGEGRTVAFGAARPALSGHWQRLVERGVNGVFFNEFEEAVLGATQPAFNQGRGTCVGQGFARALQDAILASVFRQSIMRPARIAPEFIYPAARNGIGRGQQGKHLANSSANDGTYGGWAARALVRFGSLERGVYGQYDLSKPNEMLAIRWGDPGPGVPAELYAAAADHKCDAFLCRDVGSIADALGAEHGVAICIPRIAGSRDKNGMSRLSDQGNHCTALSGVFLTPSGDLGLIYQQSWGNQPSGPDILKYAGGEQKLRQGECGIWAEELEVIMRRAGQTGAEAWAINLQAGNEFRPDSLMA